MARGAPDEETYTPRVMPEDLPRKVIPQMSGASIGGGIAAFGDVIQQKYQADSATWAGDQLAQARIKAVQTLDQMKQDMPAGDPGDFAGKFMKSFTDQNKSLLENDQVASNPYARQMLSKGLQDLSGTLFEHAKMFEAQQRVQYRSDSFTQNLQSQLPIVQAHPELAEQVGSTLADQVRAIGGGNEVMLPKLRLMHEQLSQAAADGLTRQNPQGMLDALKDPQKAPPALQSVLSGLSPAQREAIEGRATKQVSDGIANSVVAVYRSQGPTAGAKALAAIDVSNQSDDIKAQARADVERGVAQWRDEARQTHGEAIMGLEDRLGSGKVVPGDRDVALSLYRSGANTAAQTGELLGRIDKAQEKKVDDDAMYHYATESYQKGVALDPKDEHVTKAMDAVFTMATNNVQPGSPEWTNRAADIGAKTGVTPPSAVSWARTQLIGGDPQSAASAANAIQRITDANPRGAPLAIDEHTRAMARLINDATHAGTQPEVAVENARKLTSLPDADRQRLEEIYKGKQLGQKAEGDLKNQLKDPDNGFRPHFWNSIPDVPPQMTGQFEELRQNYFKLTGGNVDQANKLATADLKNTWGITAVNGKKEFMQFAPEQMNPGLTTEAVRADLEASAKGHTDDPTKVRLLTTQDTYQSSGQRWAIGVPDKFGAYSALTDEKGRVIPYQLPTGTQALKDQIAKASAEGMARLHEQQAIEHEREKNELGEIYAQGRHGGAF